MFVDRMCDRMFAQILFRLNISSFSFSLFNQTEFIRATTKQTPQEKGESNNRKTHQNEIDIGEYFIDQNPKKKQLKIFFIAS